MMELTIWGVGRMCQRPMPQLGKRGYCPFRKHKRTDKTVAVFRSKNSEDILYKCFSCDPPNNVGDALQLYAGIFDIDRKTAWHDLRDRGYDVPGLRDDYRHRPSDRRARQAPPRTPVRGDVNERVVPLDLGHWRKWSQSRPGALDKFATQRGLDVEVMRQYDALDVSTDLIGFGYRDPMTHIPCRVKMRTVERKSYWIEPRPPEDEMRAKAAAPLYLAHALAPQASAPSWALITEGEVDALTLRQMGIPNVVSLPDGAASASRVDVEPLTHGFELWLTATDADEDGLVAHNKLYQRANHAHLSAVRVLWRHSGGCFKDANEALCAGFTRDDFVRCLQEASQAVTMGVAI